jgi:putative SOS response-associated peptidase YedK
VVTYSTQRDEIRRDVEADEWIDEEAFIPRYNIAPRSQAPVIRRRGGDDPGPSGSRASDGVILHTMKWGLVPHWSKVEDKSLSTTNARSENLVEGGGMWASIKGKKRCAVPCLGYVWP